MDRDKLVAQIKTNCNISDAQFWGYYSICGLLMRLRELFGTERFLMPWEEIPQKDFSEWIGEREKLWEALGNEGLHALEIDGKEHHPFDVDEINAALKPHCLLYGGGYGMFNKPVFFLASLEGDQDFYDYRIHRAGKEFCRDISAPVAMLQGRCIVVRRERITALLWEKFLELRGRRFGGALERAFAAYGIGKGETFSQELKEKIEKVSADITDLFLLHEIGEAYEDEAAEEWLSLLGRGPDKWTELYLRAVKDLLADTSVMGPLKAIADRKRSALFSFYLALLDGLRKELFPEILDAFQRFSEGGEDWAVIEEARMKGYRKAQTLRRAVLSLAGEDTAAIKRYLEGIKKEGWSVPTG